MSCNFLLPTLVDACNMLISFDFHHCYNFIVLPSRLSQFPCTNLTRACDLCFPFALLATFNDNHISGNIYKTHSRFMLNRFYFKYVHACSECKNQDEILTCLKKSWMRWIRYASIKLCQKRIVAEIGCGFFWPAWSAIAKRLYFLLFSLVKRTAANFGYNFLGIIFY